jgi:hypothetical protein
METTEAAKPLPDKEKHSVFLNPGGNAVKCSRRLRSTPSADFRICHGGRAVERRRHKTLFTAHPVKVRAAFNLVLFLLWKVHFPF